MIRWCEGFGHGSRDQHIRKWVNGIKLSDGRYSEGGLGGFPSGFSGGRLAGQNAYNLSGFFSEIGVFFAVSPGVGDIQPTWITGFAYRTPALTPGILFLEGSASKRIVLSHVGDGRIQIVLDGTVLGRSDFVMHLSRWNYLEFKVQTSHAAGILSVTAEARVNGVSVVSGGGSITTAQTGFNYFQWGGPGGGITALITDIYVCDGDGSENTDFLGDVNVKALLPESDGTHTEWATSTGTTHYSLLDENPASTSDYISDGDTSGVRDSFNYPDMSYSGEVKAVLVAPLGIWDGTGSATATVNRLIVTSGTDYELTDYVVGFPSSTASSFGLSFSETNPNTTAAWTPAEVDASEFGVKRV